MTICLLNRCLTETALEGFSVLLLLLAGATKMIRLQLARVTVDLVALWAIDPVSCHVLSSLIRNHLSLFVLVPVVDVARLEPELSTTEITCFDVVIAGLERSQLGLLDLLSLLVGDVLVVFPRCKLLTTEVALGILRFLQSVDDVLTDA